MYAREHTQYIYYCYNITTHSTRTDMQIMDVKNDKSIVLQLSIVLSTIWSLRHLMYLHMISHTFSTVIL